MRSVSEVGKKQKQNAEAEKDGGVGEGKNKLILSAVSVGWDIK